MGRLLRACLCGWLGLASAASAQFADLRMPEALPELGTFVLDPVLLIERGEETPGREDLSVRHRQWEYRFASSASLARFREDPDRYAVAQGGACPRMGALSGLGRTELWSVRAGRIYLCASPGCKATFERAPERLLETDDPEVQDDEASRERGRELLDLAIRWAGGRDALSDMQGYTYGERRPVESGGRTYDYRSERVVTMPASMRSTTAWDEQSWTHAINDDSGVFATDGQIERMMDADQFAEARRRLANDLPYLLARAATGEVIGVALGKDERLGGERLALRLFGKTIEIVVDPADGRILAQRSRGWGGENALLGACEKRFTAFQRLGGVAFPTAWERSYEGERTPDDDIPEGRFTVTLTPKG